MEIFGDGKGEKRGGTPAENQNYQTLSLVYSRISDSQGLNTYRY